MKATNTAECHTCELTAQRDAGLAPLWANIFRGEFWDVVHSYNSALPGWLVLIARRHIEAIDELSEDEAVELGRLLREVSITLKEVTDCRKTYVMQFAEHPRHPHVHFHVVPRSAGLPDDRRGPRVIDYIGASEEERVDEKTGSFTI